jgi:5'-3' exoribonuclease 2
VFQVKSKFLKEFMQVCLTDTFVALFRWLSKKYPKIVSPVIEEQPREVDGVMFPVDATGPNPNDEEFDNLYLDMNGIVHPCSHPEDKPPPQDEEEMMVEIFKYTERVFNMVRPRKLLMIAVGLLFSITNFCMTY